MSEELTIGDPEAQALLKEAIVYDGEQYQRESLTELVESYHTKHTADLSKLEGLRKAHDEIAAEMSKDLARSRSAWEYVKDMMQDDFASNFKGLLEKIPIVNEFVADRPLGELLREKIEVAEDRTKEIGQFLSVIEESIGDLQNDIIRLNKKVIVAAENEEMAARHVLKLKDLETRLAADLEAMADKSSAEYRKKESDVTQVRQAIWHHGAKLRLFSNAEDRIAAIVRMNNNFLEILTNLHSNMQQLHDAGLEVLDELRGNLSGLATASEAGELTLDMQNAMQSLKTSVNKVAVLASDTALYLTQNVERMSSEMKVYDEETQKLVESNLEAEREIRENRINETIALAEKEYGLMQTARQDAS